MFEKSKKEFNRSSEAEKLTRTFSLSLFHACFKGGKPSTFYILDPIASEQAELYDFTYLGAIKRSELAGFGLKAFNSYFAPLVNK